ncbi:MAG: FHA domain-containing protein [Verrucomicrobiota bacterium]
MPIGFQPLNGDGSDFESFTISGEPGVFRLGRSSRNEIRIDHTSISAVHARIEVAATNGIDVVDCGSSNGTFVNGARIERSPIEIGDLVKFASIEFRIVEGEEVASLNHPHGEESSVVAYQRALSEIVSDLSEEWGELFPRDVREDHESDPLVRLGRMRDRLREEVANIAPIWREFGSEAQAELKRRCEELEDQEAEIRAERETRAKELETLQEEKKIVREELDREIRRTQGLSRKATEIEVPERVQSMLLLKDREKAVFSAVIEHLEFFDRLLDGYRRNKKLKEVVYELEEFRRKLVELLEENGVREFELSPGLELTLKHRREVQILGKKGWGTREHVAQPFQPGVVARVVRSGYRVGEGETAEVLRRVEVLIREGDD